jgi:hypothetical protein
MWTGTCRSATNPDVISPLFLCRSQGRYGTDTWLFYRDSGTEERPIGGDDVRILLRKMKEAVERITSTGAMLNARHEIDRAAESEMDLDAQLHWVGGVSTPHAA